MSMREDVHVYPKAIDLPDVGNVPGGEAGVRYEWGHAPFDDCALCKEGLCRQMIETCPTWGAALVVHCRVPES